MDGFNPGTPNPTESAQRFLANCSDLDYDQIFVYLLFHHDHLAPLQDYKNLEKQAKINYFIGLLSPNNLGLDFQNLEEEIKNKVLLFDWTDLKKRCDTNLKRMNLEHDFKNNKFFDNLALDQRLNATSRVSSILDKVNNTLESRIYIYYLHFLDTQNNCQLVNNFISDSLEELNVSLKFLSSFIKFLNKNEDGQLLWIHQYLVKKFYPNPTLSIFKPIQISNSDNNINIEELKDVIVMEIIINGERNSGTEPSLMMMLKLTTTLKNSWAQQKFRVNEKTKKKFHLPLTKQAKINLSFLADRYNLSESAVLEKLINEDFKKNVSYFKRLNH